MSTRHVCAVLAAAALLFGFGLPAEAIVVLSEDFAVDPGWEGVGNRSDGQDFGFSDTNNAGGAPGEIGGKIVRTPLAYYADDVGTLDASTDALTVSGKGILQDGRGNVLIGWFNKDGNLAWDHNSQSFLGFRSDDNDLYLFADGGGPQIGFDLSGPFTFEVSWDPTTGELSGSVNGGAVETRSASPDSFEDFNRFGIMNLYIDGNDQDGNMFFDDLSYTSAIPEPSTLVLLMGGLLALFAGRRWTMK